ncbi:MAG: adenylate/guanylate cyclase domain-containing protein, partial [Casimicrobiaceae bacterium]
ALHEGDVFFGNVGAAARLDFTVIGRAVNEASRIESLTKTLQRPILLSAAVARRVGRPLESMGEHHLRGLAAPVSLYSPRPRGH